jgi:hypothetical protein
MAMSVPSVRQKVKACGERNSAVKVGRRKPHAKKKGLRAEKEIKAVNRAGKSELLFFTRGKGTPHLGRVWALAACDCDCALMF